MISSQESTIYLIRHAEKINNSNDSDLNEKGKLRAKQLADFFSDKNLEIIFTTLTYRAQQTAAPIAVRTNSETILYQKNALKISDLINLYKGKNILIVGHSNTIPMFLNELTGEYKYSEIPEDEYDWIFEIKINKSSILIEKYNQ